MISFFVFFAFIAFSVGAQPPQKQMRTNFRVKSYHLKAKKTVWDSKTTILNADTDVVISLFLQDGTTAFIYADHAQEDRARGQGKAWGHVRLVWGDLTVVSPEATFDANQQTATFVPKGSLKHNNFIRGHLDMDFSNLTAKVDSQNFTQAVAGDAKGIWRPEQDIKR